jgi:hypothetical protein
MSIFAKAKAAQVAKTSAAKKTKHEIAIAGIQNLAEIKAMMASLAAVAATLEGSIKDAGFNEFLAMETQVRPESFKGVDGQASASVEMRKRGTNSALNADEVAVLENFGLTPFKQVVTVEMFGINPAFAADSKLMNKVSKALEKIVPEGFIVVQAEESKMVVNDDLLEAAFKLEGDDRAEALRIVTTMALKPKLEASYDMNQLQANVLALINTVEEDQSAQKVA